MPNQQHENENIIVDLIKAYTNLMLFYEDLQIEKIALIADDFSDAILDLIGIPEDETVNDSENGFCRDWFYEILSDLEMSSEQKLKTLMKGKTNV